MVQPSLEARNPESAWLTQLDPDTPDGPQSTTRSKEPGVNLTGSKDKQIKIRLIKIK